MPQQKKIPMRRCLGCMESFPKKELIRVVRKPDGEVTLDFRGKVSGRGAYVCRRVECLKKAEKAKRLSRALECEIPDGVMERLRAEMESGDGDE